MDILKKITRVLSIICYIIIGIYAVICLPMIIGAKPVVVLSGSMRPTFEVGTIIYYRPTEQSQINKDDIITFQMGDQLVTHRVIEVINGEFLTQGDANNINDGKPVPYSNVQGKVMGLSIPFLGYGINLVHSNMWIFIVIVAILVAEFLLSNIKSDKISVSEKGRKHEKED